MGKDRIWWREKWVSLCLCGGGGGLAGVCVCGGGGGGERGR